MDGRQYGFTLIELVMVILVVSIVGIATAAKWQATAMSVGAQANQLANDIRYAQALAMTNSKRYYLIKQSTTTYQILDSSGTAVNLVTGSTTVTLRSGITFGTLTNLPSNLVAFDAEGTPYITSTTPGTALASNATMPLVTSANTVTVTILAGTGSVSVS